VLPSKLVASAPSVHLGAVHCTRYAGPTGADSNPGSSGSPYRSVQLLVDGLHPGQTGCLLAGTYREDVTFRHSGAPGRPLTLASAPGGVATVRGLLWVTGAARNVTVRDLVLDGRSSSGQPSPQVNGDNATFYEDDVTNDHTGICFVIGGSAATYGTPHHTTIARSRIHDCGRLPRTHFEHGIYVEHSRGAVIVDNAIYDNADWGLHLFPDAQRSLVEFNVVDGNGDGVMIAGTDDMASSGNRILRNIFSNTTDDSGSSYGYHVTSFWGRRVGTGNVVAHNCFWNGRGGNVNIADGGFAVGDNRVANPRYVARATGNFALRSGSPCAGDGPRGR